ncbi:MAG: PQQ-binding-like beta-propeller repeat protein [Bacteroidetes bacterium]|nr:PQQ-binding-like beta-propeller repeat protein [Bacteroidota bacterium]
MTEQLMKIKSGPRSRNIHKVEPKSLAGRALTVIAGCAAALVMTACSQNDPVLKGDRISVLPVLKVETPMAAAFDEGAGLPVEVNINQAVSVGLTAGHSGGNPRLQAPLKRIWTAKIGGAGTELTDLAPPVVGNGMVYTVAPNGVVRAFDVKNGKQNWSIVIDDLSDDPMPGIGGGLALTPNGLAVHAGGTTLALLNAESGEIVWTVEFDIPLRGGPTIVGDDRLAVTDLDGNITVMTLVAGDTVWIHYGLAANTILYGAPSPAFANDSIVQTGAGGEVSYFDASNGDLLWTDSVASLLPRTPIQSLGDVRAHPVHDGGLIYVVSQSGRLVAFSARNGLPVWERAIAGLEMPWAAGESLFITSLDGRLYSLRRSDGAVRWVTELAGAVPLDVIVPEDPPRYVGPVVAGGRVYVVSGNGRVQSFNADTGVEIASFDAGVRVLTTPQLATGRMFLLGRDGQLIAFE